ncbi:hypothetical protein RJ639_019050 [Escallonia herrerae]|uniref:Cation/H+ exchanger transmembrane domain-containing protein n=1 Tax=Escallonia herrerae TaxID=1293975 RepID=A0AA89AHR0_9ASTE|nr:hypothetical protein RJ639_019050 [Escallonia herrerae]
MDILALESDKVSIDSVTLFVALVCACIVIGHLFEENRWMNESITALAIGFCTGIVILLTSGGKSSRLLEFNEELFFIFLLPPIIFNAGFQVKKKQFFQNFMTIILFGALGTMISFGVISFGMRKLMLAISASQLFKRLDIGYLEIADYLAIGAIFSATDSVCTLQVLNQEETPLLHSLVFGEGVVNDATSVVLFNAIQRFDPSRISSGIALQFVGNFLSLFFTSTLLGVSVGLASAYIIKKYVGAINFDELTFLLKLEIQLGSPLLTINNRTTEELFDLSGILTVFFCGIVMSHYTWHNVTESSRVTTKHAFATMSFVAEIFIFLYVGMDALDIEKWRFASKSLGKSIGISSILLGLVLVARASFVFPLSFFSNVTRKSKSEKTDFKQQVTIWWAGLMRGAVSMALAYSQFTRAGRTQQPGNAIMITSTITVVLFSTVVYGLMTKALVRFLMPPLHLIPIVSSEPSSPKSTTLPLISNSRDSEADMGDHNVPRPTSLRMLLSTPTHTVHHYWRKFDDRFMRPVFGGRGFVPLFPGSPPERSLHGTLASCTLGVGRNG